MGVSSSQIAIATRYLSNVVHSDEAIEEFNRLKEEIAIKVGKFISSLSPDRRSIAIGGLDEIWRWEVQKSYYQDGYTILGAQLSQHPLIALIAAKGNNVGKVFIGSPDVQNYFYAWMHNNNRSYDITFLNYVGLYLFEKYYKTSHPMYDIDYSVVDVEDLYSTSELYDVITVVAWDVAHNEDYLNALINSLAPGGSLILTISNASTKLYESNFEMHTFYDMHETLKSVPNSTLIHDPAMHGTTILVKH